MQNEISFEYISLTHSEKMNELSYSKILKRSEFFFSSAYFSHEVDSDDLS